MVYFRAKIIFGLNALYGKSIQSDGSAIGAWNYTNAESLIRYTVKNNYTIHGWELGKNYIYCIRLLYNLMMWRDVMHVFVGQEMN